MTRRAARISLVTARRRTGTLTSAPSAVWGAAAWGAAAVLALGSCSGNAGNARTASVEASGDGTLRIGLILDNTGPQAFLNEIGRASCRERV